MSCSNNFVIPKWFKLLLLSFINFTAVYYCIAQQKITYDYDVSGNRISRRIIMLPQNAPKNQVKQTEPIKVEIGERMITIYPNPTKGALAINIQGGDEKDEMRATVFDATGKIIINTKLVFGESIVDLSRFPATWYILRINEGQKMSEYKILKQ